MSDQRFMSLALSIGRRGLGRTWPNPSVGCIIVSGNQIIGRGATADGGRPHAEIIALAQAGAKAKAQPSMLHLSLARTQAKLRLVQKH